MERVLETADFVKFAKVRPLPDDNVRAFTSAMQFVEDTKPKPAPAEEASEEGDKNAASGKEEGKKNENNNPKP